MASLNDLIRPSFMLFTTVLYGVLMYVLLKGRKTLFSSSFYALFVSTAIADMLNLLQRVFMMDLTTLFFAEEWLSLGNKLPLAAITLGLSWCINYSQIFGTVAISINRFSAVALPMWYQKFWTKEKLRVILLLQWILPTLWIYPLFSPCCQVAYFDNDTSNTAFEDETVNSLYTFLQAIVNVAICVPLIVLMNFLTVLISVKNRKKANLDSEIARERKNAEMRLAFVGIIISVSYVSSVVFGTLWALTSSGVVTLDANVMAVWFFRTTDTFTLCNPYILLILSGVTRTEFFRMLGYKRVMNLFNDQSVSAGTVAVRPVPLRK